MTPQLATAWVKALRSGKYKQGKGQLRYEEDHGIPATHCCLGVLAEVCRTRKPFADFDLSDEALQDSNNVDLTDLGMLEAVGLEPDDQEFLIARNDGCIYKPEDKDPVSWSFKQIANWIERKFITGPAKAKLKGK